MNLLRCRDPGAYQRANYVRLLQSWDASWAFAAAGPWRGDRDRGGRVCWTPSRSWGGRPGLVRAAGRAAWLVFHVAFFGTLRQRRVSGQDSSRRQAGDRPAGWTI